MKNESQSNVQIVEEKNKILLALVKGILIAYAVTCIAFIICAALLRYSSFTEDKVSLFVTITTVVSVIISGFDTARSADKNGWLWGMISGAIYAVILICIQIWVSGYFSFDMRGLTLIVLSIASGGLGGMIGINFEKNKA